MVHRPGRRAAGTGEIRDNIAAFPPGVGGAAEQEQPAQCRVCAGRWLTPCPAYGPCGLPLIYSPLLLKLPVLRPQHR
ncbi:hypothetical protein B8P98_14775 [Klebsiella quasivariicola]|nr:hypothetical protein B8P98_14775 [Klebsiella quasivariicola]